MDEGGGLHSTAKDGTESEAVPTLQTRTAAHRRPCVGTQSNGKEVKGCFTSSSGTRQIPSLHSMNYRDET